MKGLLLLADSATVHDDRTVSVLRGCLNTFRAPKGKLRFKGSMLMVVRGESTDHSVKLTLLLKGAAQNLLELNGTVEVSTGDEMEYNAPLVANIEVLFPEPGTYEFVLQLNGEDVDRWPLHVLVANAHD